MQEPKIRVVAYVRVSTKGQSLDRQIEEIEKYAAENNYIIEKYFEDKVSSIKVSIDKRNGFNKLKKYLFDNRNTAKTLLVHEVSRLGRKNFEVQNVIEDFSQKRVNIHIMDMRLSTLNENGIKSPESNIIISILASMAENENRLLSDRIKGGLLSSAKKGLAFSEKITGYKKGKDGKPLIDPSQAPIVRRMYELASNNTTLYFITKKIKEEFGKEFGSKTISGIIKNPFYKGTRMYLGEPIPVDPIVDIELWESANNFLNTRKVFTKRYQVNVNVVEGKIDCYKCGNPMYQVVIKKGRSDMFKCSKKCSRVTVNRPWLYEMIRYVVEKHTKKVNDKKFKNSLNKQIKENQELEADLVRQKDSTESAQLRNYDMFLKGKIKETIYDKTNENYTKDLNYISLQLNECQKRITSYKKALKTEPKHFSNDLKTFKVQIQELLHYIEVSEDFVIINIENLVNYKITQLSGTEIGWLKRKYNGEGMMYRSPFNTGIEIKNIFSDEDLQSLAAEQINPNFQDEIQQYLESEDYKNKINNSGSLGGSNNKSI